MTIQKVHENVRCEIEGGAAHLTLERPEVLNAIDLATIEALREIFVRITADDTVRAVSITGSGRAFSAGGDIRSMLDMAIDSEAPEAAMSAAVSALHAMFSLLHRLPKPVVAAVNGPAAGAGVGLLLHAGIAWAAPGATFTLAFTGIGVSPDSGTTYHLPRLVGPRLATELFLTNRKLNAEEALALGLVTRVVEDDNLVPEVRRLAERLAQGPTGAFGRVRELVRDSLENGYETQLARERVEVGRSARTKDFAEGLRAFLEKRRADFCGG
jgi:2-(1,2-epoxy-1,2-dihydrophenyl)acetyl-CoA isomerase